MTLAEPSLPIEKSHTDSRDLIAVTVRSVKRLADNIQSYELVAENLPVFTPGSHIDVHLPCGLIRQYSLCNDATEENRYVIAVQRDKDSRGGGAYLFESVHPGDALRISSPRNNFPLVRDNRRVRLVAGGIGITPILSMILECRRRGIEFHLYYCVHARQRAAFLDILQPLIETGHASVYVSSEGQRLDLDRLFEQPSTEEHIYYCGPGRLMDQMAQVTAKWPDGVVHFERFNLSDAAEAQLKSEADHAFEIQLLSSGKIYTVEPNETIVQVLRRDGVHIDTSCEQGYCGTCMTRYVGGIPDHRDSVLDDGNRKHYLMICCSRTKEGPLILDL
jgi:vanillate O-demethylase ferredoxin subunit